jgi:hypothetical protein
MHVGSGISSNTHCAEASRERWGNLDQRGPREPSALQGGGEAVGDAERPPGCAVLGEESRRRLRWRRRPRRPRPWRASAASWREEAPRPSGREEEEAAGSVGGASEGREPRQAERERRVTAAAGEFAESAATAGEFAVSVGGVERKRPKGLWYRLLLRTGTKGHL